MCTHPIQLGYAKVPCGQCKECRRKFAIHWAVRCVLESLEHKENVFLTLTYDPEFLPENRSLNKKVLQNFMKRFRKQIYPAKCRFFASGEYGKKEGKRPHYHLLIFGIGLSNPVFENLSWDFRHNGFWCTCKAWKNEKGQSLGNCFIGTVTIKSSYYVAKYSVKKLTGKAGKEYYDKRGVIPEFALQSRKPGIGLSYLDHHQDEVAHKGYVSINGSKFPLPRYLLQKCKERIPYFDLLLSSESFERSVKELEDWSRLADELEDVSINKYLEQQKIQRDLNLKKQDEMKGVL